MPLPTSNTVIGKDDFDNSMTVPHIVKRLVFKNGLNLRGAEGALLESFRFNQLLDPAETKQALFNKLRPSREELACLLFDVFNQILKKLNFKYSYTANQPVFSYGIAVDNMDMSCMGCTRSFAGLLYSFGFAPGSLYMHVSNPTNNDGVKVVMKPRLNADSVKGIGGTNRAAEYDAETMAPTHDELSNGFKLQTLMTGGHAVKMVPRDPFLNHFTLFVDAGFQFPHFDPLIGARYQNGQENAFSGYQRWATGDITYNRQKTEVFKHTENDQARLYSIPSNIDFSTNPDFIKAKAKYLPEDLKLWIIVDPEDWMQNTAQVTRNRSTGPAPAVSAFAPQPVRPAPAMQMGSHRPAVAHPPNICQLFGLPL